MKTKYLFTAVLCFLLFALYSQAPRTLNYQGALSDQDGMALTDAVYDIEFLLYDAPTGGNNLWSETHSVELRNGIFTVLLGETSPLDLSFDKALWLGMRVDGETLEPRTALSASAYSLGGMATELKLNDVAELNKGFAIPINTSDTSMYMGATEDWFYISQDTGQFANSKNISKFIDINLDAKKLSLFVKNLTAESNNLSIFAQSYGADAINAFSADFRAIAGQSLKGSGIYGKSDSGYGVFGESKSLTGVFGRSERSIGVHGYSPIVAGVLGQSDEGIGVSANSTKYYGLLAESTESDAVHAIAKEGRGVFGSSDKKAGVYGVSIDNYGVYGSSLNSAAVYGEASNDTGVYGTSSSNMFAGVSGFHNTGFGVFARSENGIGLLASGAIAAARMDGDVLIESNGKLKIDNVPDEESESFLVWGSDKFVKKRSISDLVVDEFTGTLIGHDLIVQDDQGTTVFEVKTDGTSYHKGTETFEDDVVFKGTDGKGAKWVDGSGMTLAGFGRKDLDTGMTMSVYGKAISSNDRAGVFDGKVDIFGSLCVDDIQVGELCINSGLTIKDDSDEVVLDIDPNADPNGDYGLVYYGNLMVFGGIAASFKNFVIDHPLDPENKILRHYSIESDQLKNSYDGNVILDKNGDATVTLPHWFEALNTDFRYQLTCIGGFANVYISEKVKDNQFKISGGFEGLEVSWQVTGIRHDKEALENLRPIEEYKNPK